jgi:hypothetical protein
MKDIYTPRPGSLPARIIEFFQENPEEELSRADIAAKFVVASSTIDACLAAAIDFGGIATRTNDDLQRVWVAGPNIRDCRTGVLGKAAGGGGKRPSRQPTAPPANMPKPGELVIEKGIPVPEVVRAGSTYIAVFESMEPGDSFLVPADCAKRVMDYACKWARRTGGRKFTQRRLAEGSNVRIWRSE